MKASNEQTWIVIGLPCGNDIQLVAGFSCLWFDVNDLLVIELLRTLIQFAFKLSSQIHLLLLGFCVV